MNDARGGEVSDRDIVGYTVAYEKEELHFPVYVLAMIAVIFFGLGVVRENPWLFALGLPLAVAFYYNYPLLETGRPRIGAGQYGMFVEGLGLIQWRAIDAIEVAQTHLRGDTLHDLQVFLKMPLSDALIIDWRHTQLPRKFMRRPWSMPKEDLISIPLDIMDKPYGDIRDTLLRMWRYYRGQ